MLYFQYSFSHVSHVSMLANGRWLEATILASIAPNPCSQMFWELSTFSVPFFNPLSKTRNDWISTWGELMRIKSTYGKFWCHSLKLYPLSKQTLLPQKMVGEERHKNLPNLREPMVDFINWTQISNKVIATWWVRDHNGGIKRHHNRTEMIQNATLPRVAIIIA